FFGKAYLVNLFCCCQLPGLEEAWHLFGEGQGVAGPAGTCWISEAFEEPYRTAAKGFTSTENKCVFPKYWYFILKINWIWIAMT
ncbi:hypothetical protein ACJX0J_036035, partial [Zea mays]